MIEDFVLTQLERDLFSHEGIEKLRDNLIQYQQRRQSTIAEDKEKLRIEKEEVKQKIQKIVELVSQSGITIGTVSQELKILEEKRLHIEEQIDKLSKEATTLTLSEKQIEQMKEHRKEVKEKINLKKLRQIISYYIENVTVYHEGASKNLLFFRK